VRFERIQYVGISTGPSVRLNNAEKQSLTTNLMKRRNIMKRTLIFSLFTVICIFFCLGVAFAKAEFVLKIGDVYPIGSGYNELMIEYFIPTIHQRTNGRIEVQYFPQGQLGSETQMLNKVRQSVMQGMCISASVTGDILTKHQILNMPFLFRNWKEMRIFTYSPEGQELMEDDLWSPLGLKAINFHHYSYFNVATARDKVDSFEKVKEIKFRLPPSGSFREHFAAWHMKPISTPFGEIYSSLKQGVMDGLPHTDMIIHTLKLYEVINYITRTESLVGWEVMIYNNKWYNALPKNLQDILTDVSTKLNMMASIAIEKQDYKAQLLFAKKGIEIIELSPKEKEKFREASRPVYNKMKKDIGEDYVNRVEKRLGHGF